MCGSSLQLRREALLCYAFALLLTPRLAEGASAATYRRVEFCTRRRVFTWRAAPGRSLESTLAAAAAVGGGGAPFEAVRVRDVDAAVEAWLRDAFGAIVDFNVAQAVDACTRVGLLEAAGDGMVRAVPMGDALEALEGKWGGFMKSGVE